MTNPFYMKRFLHFFVFISILTISWSCSKDDDNNPNNNEDIPTNLEIENFIWKGLNLFYLWQSQVSDLSDQRFSSQEQLNEYLKQSNSPEDLFYSLLYNYPDGDEYSWIVDDYIALEEQLYEGITGSNGMEYGLVFEEGSSTNIFGYVRYIIADSDASTKDLQRGDIFHAINGTPLTIENYRDLLFSTESYTLNLANYNNGNPVDNGNSINLTKTELQENPIHTVTSINDSGKNIGYLLYNGFTSAFNSQLNDAFATLKADGVTDLVLDLRYNSGGSIQSAIYLAGMITGQFTGELFSKETWNEKWEEYYNENDPEYLINNFVDQMENGEALNNLNLENLVVLTTGSSASASELIINGLKPYIKVTTIGTTTEGKAVGSVTIYDSESFGRENINPNHTYAMQPIVLEIVNKLGENDKDGFEPTVFNPEDLGDLGILGNPAEPLFARAIQFIIGGSKFTVQKENVIPHAYFSDSKKESPTSNNMYIDKLPNLK